MIAIHQLSSSSIIIIHMETLLRMQVWRMFSFVCAGTLLFSGQELIHLSLSSSLMKPFVVPNGVL